MYRSPIEILTTDIQTQIDKGLEEETFKAVVSVGINVDKDELIRALAYDRNQYRDGYNDGYRDGKNSAMEDIAFPRFLARPPEPSKEELEALMYSPATIITDKESITQICPYSRWIPVSERLPENREDVLLCRKWWNEIRNPQMGWYNDVSRAWFDLSNREIHNVTHWMPLPEPPKELGPAEGR